MILAFDPGVSTGIAILEEDGSVVNTYVRSFDEMSDEFITGLSNIYKDAAAVAEQGPLTGNYRPLTQTIEERLRKAFPKIEWVTPGQWKGHPAARSAQALPRLTQHERDAVGLGRWFKARRNRGQTAQ
jgi:hypothetical protein